MDNFVNYCTDGNAAACAFWRQRCADNLDCGACLAGMGDDDNLRAMAADWSTPACKRILGLLYEGVAPFYLLSITTACPGSSACRYTVTNCVMQYGDLCVACINGSALQSSKQPRVL